VTINRHLSATLIVVILAGSCGCGASGAGPLANLVPVKGKVTYKGQALTEGVVRFEPEGFGRPASGKLQPDGTFELSTLNVPGVVAGHHRVSISTSSKNLAKDRGFRKYASPNTSGLTAEVTADKTDFPFDLQ
jgi:hypothetical protein